MKIDEIEHQLSKKSISEGWFADLANFKGKKSWLADLARLAGFDIGEVPDKFVNDFVKDAESSIKGAETKGLLSKSASNATNIKMDNIVSSMRKLAPSGDKKIPPNSKIYKEILAGLPNVRLNKDYLTVVGDKILKLNNAGYDVKDLHKQYMMQLARGIKQKSINEAQGRYSLSQFLYEWVKTYMKGVDLEKYTDTIKKQLKVIEELYNSDKNYVPALKDLGQLAFAIAKNSSSMPAGIKNLVSSTNSGQGSTDDIQKLKSSLQNLAKTNPKAYADLLKRISARK